MQLEPATTGERVEQVRALFLEYAAALGFSLCFQGFDRELAELPGAYAPPGGRLLLAVENGVAVGCVALRRLAPDSCEMKRLYVRPEYRGQGIGRGLVDHVIAEARKIGYQTMRLDTVPQMKAAIALYESVGFQDGEPYRPNPIPGARYMQLMLSASDTNRGC